MRGIAACRPFVSRNEPPLNPEPNMIRHPTSPIGMER